MIQHQRFCFYLSVLLMVKVMHIKLCGMTPDEILTHAGRNSGTLRDAVSAANSLYKRRISNIEEFPGLPKAFRKELLKSSETGFFSPSDLEMSVDHTVKYLFRNDQGLLYETVYIPDGKRNSVCVSTQSGCRMGCPFCATGKYGFHGNLSVRDIVNQIISVPVTEKITHVVFMGMGEPMDNLDNVLKACRIITAQWGMAVGVKNVTVSTIGIEPAIREFLEKCGCNLSFSLFSPFPEERIRVIPAERKYPARRIIDLMKQHSTTKKRRMTIAYVMIKGINDTDKHLEAIIKLAGGSKVRVNLLTYHRIQGEVYESSSPEKMHYFKYNLITSGISASIRRSRGEDVSAACGLLASGIQEYRIK